MKVFCYNLFQPFPKAFKSQGVIEVLRVIREGGEGTGSGEGVQGVVFQEDGFGVCGGGTPFLAFCH